MAVEHRRIDVDATSWRWYYACYVSGDLFRRRVAAGEFRCFVVWAATLALNIVPASTINVVLSWSDMQCLKFWFSSLFWYSLIHSYR